MPEVRYRKVETEDEPVDSSANETKRPFGHLGKVMNKGVVNILFVLSLSFMACSIYYVHYNVRMNEPSMSSLVESLGFTLRCLAVSSVVMLFWNIVATIAKRVTNGKVVGNPLQGNEHLMLVHQRILQNTLEQFAMHSFSLLSLATFLGPATVKFIPLACGLFTIGRITFWIGYPRNRTFGFILTMFPTSLVITANMYFAYKFGLLSSSGAADALYAPKKM